MTVLGHIGLYVCLKPIVDVHDSEACIIIYLEIKPSQLPVYGPRSNTWALLDQE